MTIRTITTRHRQDDWIAFINDNECLWSAGKSENEAVGRCIRAHAHSFDIEIKNDIK